MNEDKINSLKRIYRIYKDIENSDFKHGVMKLEEHALYSEFNQIKNNFILSIRDNDIGNIKRYINEYGTFLLNQSFIKVNINVGNNYIKNTTFLSSCIIFNKVRIFKLLLESGADVNIRNDVTGITPLLEAISQSKYIFIKILLSYNADPNMYSLSEYTPLSLAAYNRDIQAIEILLDNDKTDINYVTPLNRYTTLNIIIYECGDMNKIDRIEGYGNVIKILYKYGLSIDMKFYTDIINSKIKGKLIFSNETEYKSGDLGAIYLYYGLIQQNRKIYRLLYSLSIIKSMVKISQLLHQNLMGTPAIAKILKYYFPNNDYSGLQLLAIASYGSTNAPSENNNEYLSVVKRYPHLF